MTVFLWDHKLTYVAVPKVACTSLKHMFFEIENGFPFRSYAANGTRKHIHNACYPSVTFDRLPHERIADHLRLTLVRDPVQRFLSAYGNRVVALRELSGKQAGVRLRKAGLRPNPSLSEFVDRLEDYRAASASIAHHTDPLTCFLGGDPGYFAEIYNLRNIETFRQRIEAAVGRPVAIPRLQTGGPKLSPDDLSADERRKVEAFYAEDYEVYGAIF